MQKTRANGHVESSATLSSQLYSSVSEFSSLKVSVMSVQWLTAERKTSIFLHALSYALVIVLLTAPGIEFFDAAVV